MSKSLNTINKELKVYINESSFISQKCRNRLLTFFSQEFDVDLDISNYQNVDLSIQDDFKILYRDDLYSSNGNIQSLDDVLERYERFQEKADKLIAKKEVDFQSKNNVSNITNLVIVICMLLIAILVLLFCVYEFFQGHYFDCIWFLVFIVPVIAPKFRASLENRFQQAKNYLKHILRKKK